MPNKLYFGDTIDVMRDWIEDESIDLGYLDLPFKSVHVTMSCSNRLPVRKTGAVLVLGLIAATV